MGCFDPFENYGTGSFMVGFDFFFVNLDLFYDTNIASQVIY